MHPITYRLLRLTQGLTGGREIFLGFANPDWRESQTRGPCPCLAGATSSPWQLLPIFWLGIWAALKRPGRETVGTKETVKFWGQFGHVSFASVVLRIAGYGGGMATDFGVRCLCDGEQLAGKWEAEPGRGEFDGPFVGPANAAGDFRFSCFH